MLLVLYIYLSTLMFLYCEFQVHVRYKRLIDTSLVIFTLHRNYITYQADCLGDFTAMINVLLFVFVFARGLQHEQYSAAAILRLCLRDLSKWSNHQQDFPKHPQLSLITCFSP